MVMKAANFEYEISTLLWYLFPMLSQMNRNKWISSIFQKCDYTVKEAQNIRKKLCSGISVRENPSNDFSDFLKKILSDGIFHNGSICWKFLP